MTLQNADAYGGTTGGRYDVADFAMAKYPITNAQYEKFLTHPNGYTNLQWWNFSSQAEKWRKDHQRPKPTAFSGTDLPRTRVSWFDSVAFCHWLAVELANKGYGKYQDAVSPHTLSWCVRLPTEQEWQCAAIGDTGWRYPWGDEIDETAANYAGRIGQPTSVKAYPQDKSVFGITDMIGNVWEWCLTGWGQAAVDMHGYTHRVIKGGAWNVSHPEHLWAIDRGAHPPRGRLNDCGFRCGYYG